MLPAIVCNSQVVIQFDNVYAFVKMGMKMVSLLPSRSSTTQNYSFQMLFKQDIAFSLK